MDTTQTLAFRALLTEAVKKDASDLHLSVGSYPMIRTGGSLKSMDDQEIISERSIKDIVDTLLPQDKRDLLEQKRDLVFTTVFDGKIRAKIHIFFQEHMLSVSVRFLSISAKTLRELECPQALDRLLSFQDGLVIIGGNQDSGRTTLAAAILEQINRTKAAHIITLENPIEYDLLSNMSIVNQREVGSDTPSFQEGLEACQKEDVDVLFVSEFSDPEVMKKVLDLANAGVYVITIMNTDSAIHAIERMITSFHPHEEAHIRGLIADVLRGIVIQELVPKIGGGFASVHEVLLNTPSVRTLIISNRLGQLDQAIKSSRGDGMISHDHELANLIRNQIVSLENARTAAKDIETLESLIRG